MGETWGAPPAGSAGQYWPHLPTSVGPTPVKAIHVRRVPHRTRAWARMAFPRSLPTLPPARSRSTWSARSEARTYDVDGRRVAAIIGDEVGPELIHDQRLQDRQLGPELVRKWGQNSPAKPTQEARCEGSGQPPAEDIALASWLPLRPGLTVH